MECMYIIWVLCVYISMLCVHYVYYVYIHARYVCVHTCTLRMSAFVFIKEY